jgi:hypothetical protein
MLHESNFRSCPSPSPSWPTPGSVSSTAAKSSSTNQPARERSRVPTLKLLAVKASASALLLYDELSDIPASIKAPVFAQLVKESHLTSQHLEVLLSRDQKKLDLSAANGTLFSVESFPLHLTPPLRLYTATLSHLHIHAVAERCSLLEQLNLSNCPSAFEGDQQPSASSFFSSPQCTGLLTLFVLLVIASIASLKHLTFLDLSNNRIITDLGAIPSLPRLRVLRAANCELRETGFRAPSNQWRKTAFVEVDLSGNAGLSPVHPLGLILPEIAPDLRIFRINAIGAGFLNSVTVATQLLNMFKVSTKRVTKLPLVELRLGQVRVAFPWLERTELLSKIFSFLDLSALEILEISGQPMQQQKAAQDFVAMLDYYLTNASRLTPNLRELNMGEIWNRLPSATTLPPNLKVFITPTLYNESSFRVLMPKPVQQVPKTPSLTHLELSVDDHSAVTTSCLIFQLFKANQHPLETMRVKMDNWPWELDYALGQSEQVAKCISPCPQPFLKRLELEGRFLNDIRASYIITHLSPRLIEPSCSFACPSERGLPSCPRAHSYRCSRFLVTDYGE